MTLKSTGKRWASVDVIKLYSRWSHEEWNAVLTSAHRMHDIGFLTKLLYGIQAGMSDAARTSKIPKESEEWKKISDWFIRAQRSIENAAKSIFREKYPNPLDDPLADKAFAFQFLDVKRKRDNAFDAFIRRASF